MSGNTQSIYVESKNFPLIAHLKNEEINNSINQENQKLSKVDSAYNSVLNIIPRLYTRSWTKKIKHVFLSCFGKNKKYDQFLQRKKVAKEIENIFLNHNKNYCESIKKINHSDENNFRLFNEKTDFYLNELKSHITFDTFSSEGKKPSKKVTLENQVYLLSFSPSSKNFSYWADVQTRLDNFYREMSLNYGNDANADNHTNDSSQAEASTSASAPSMLIHENSDYPTISETQSAPPPYEFNKY